MCDALLCLVVEVRDVDFVRFVDPLVLTSMATFLLLLFGLFGDVYFRVKLLVFIGFTDFVFGGGVHDQLLRGVEEAACIVAIVVCDTPLFFGCEVVHVELSVFVLWSTVGLKDQSFAIR